MTKKRRRGHALFYNKRTYEEIIVGVPRNTGRAGPERREMHGLLARGSQITPCFKTAATPQQSNGHTDENCANRIGGTTGCQAMAGSKTKARRRVKKVGERKKGRKGREASQNMGPENREVKSRGARHPVGGGQKKERHGELPYT